jgi:hypothetical protein
MGAIRHLVADRITYVLVGAVLLLIVVHGTLRLVQRRRRGRP